MSRENDMDGFEAHLREVGIGDDVVATLEVELLRLLRRESFASIESTLRRLKSIALTGCEKCVNKGGKDPSGRLPQCDDRCGCDCHKRLFSSAGAVPSRGGR